MEGEQKSRAKILILAIAGLLLMACLIYAFGQRRRPASQQERPRRVASSAAAKTIKVSAKGDLQSAINAAQPGDTILLEAGASFIGPFTLTAKSSPNTDSSYITIRT
ncbi:MAG TPA: hypothetical protein VM911_01760, partial [Pyrinomonadaceae bacterium]|nr:hypothetical protein [Pyrinomonadaceae bacterium]